MAKKALGLQYIFILIAITTFACSLSTGMNQQVESVKGTIQAAATDLQEGGEFLDTAQAVATQVSDSGVIETAKALATELGDSAPIQTAQALITAQGSEILETASALATEQGPSLILTAQAVISEVPPLFNDKPPDIPIVSGETENFFGTTETVSYMTPILFPNVLEFYKVEMPKNGWEKRNQGWVEAENAAVLYYVKNDRIASVTLSVSEPGKKTSVLISIQPK